MFYLYICVFRVSENGLLKGGTAAHAQAIIEVNCRNEHEMTFYNQLDCKTFLFFFFALGN